MKFLSKIKASPAWHEADSLLDGIDFAELIMTVHHNSENRDEKDVRREFQNILDARLKDAKHLLEKHMPDILKHLSESE